VAARRTLLFGSLVAAVVLAVAGAFLYGAKKTRDLESSATACAARATEQLRAASGLALGAPQTEGALRAAGDELERRLAALRAEDMARNRPLAQAAELYAVDVQAILRNQADTSRALIASGASRRALEAHLRNAAGRGAGWIQRALALKTRAERDNFDARTSAEALEGLLKAHRDSQDKLRALAPRAPLIEEAERQKLQQAAKDALQRAEDDLQRLRRLLPS